MNIVYTLEHNISIAAVITQLRLKVIFSKDIKKIINGLSNETKGNVVYQRLNYLWFKYTAANLWICAQLLKFLNVANTIFLPSDYGLTDIWVGVQITLRGILTQRYAIIVNYSAVFLKRICPFHTVNSHKMYNYENTLENLSLDDIGSSLPRCSCLSSTSMYNPRGYVVTRTQTYPTMANSKVCSQQLTNIENRNHSNGRAISKSRWMQ